MILHPIIDLLKRIVVALPDYAGGGESGGLGDFNLIGSYPITEQIAQITITKTAEISKYSQFIFVIQNVVLSASDWLRLNIDGGNYSYTSTKSATWNTELYSTIFDTENTLELSPIFMWGPANSGSIYSISENWNTLNLRCYSSSTWINSGTVSVYGR